MIVACADDNSVTEESTFINPFAVQCATIDNTCNVVQIRTINGDVINCKNSSIENCKKLLQGLQDELRSFMPKENCQ
jgi:hypothetical protein